MRALLRTSRVVLSGRIALLRSNRVVMSGMIGLLRCSRVVLSGRNHLFASIGVVTTASARTFGAWIVLCDGAPGPSALAPWMAPAGGLWARRRRPQSSVPPARGASRNAALTGDSWSANPGQGLAAPGRTSVRPRDALVWASPPRRRLRHSRGPHTPPCQPEGAFRVAPRAPWEADGARGQAGSAMAPYKARSSAMPLRIAILVFLRAMKRPPATSVLVEGGEDRQVGRLFRWTTTWVTGAPGGSLDDMVGEVGSVLIALSWPVASIRRHLIAGGTRRGAPAGRRLFCLAA